MRKLKLVKSRKLAEKKIILLLAGIALTTLIKKEYHLK